MKDQTTILNTIDESSFIGLRSYSEAQAGKFFGRDEETDQLIKLIAANTLTIIFGKSGTGKTSLLNAGVFPGLRKNYCLPFRIRLEFQDDSPDLITQVKNVLKTEIDNYGFTVDAYPGKETLWEYFHTEALWKTITPILIFDQFEEIFTLAKKSSRFAATELPLFWDELSCLIENYIPEKLKERFLKQEKKIDYDYNTQKVKVIFAFREEYLPEFESIASRIPSIKHSRFRLLPFNGTKAYEVVTKTWGNNINPVEADKIISFFTNEPGQDKKELPEVEPSLLSQVCLHIDKERIRQGGQTITAELLSRFPKELILRSIYVEALHESNAALKLHDDKKNTVPLLPMNEFVEDRLITDEGHRTSYALTRAENHLLPGIDILLQKYFLRSNDNTVELTHDVLTPLIKSDRENRRKQIAGVIAQKKARRRGLAILLFFLLAGVLTYFLLTLGAQRQKNKIEERITMLRSDSTKLDSLVGRLRSDSAGLTKGSKDSSDLLSKNRQIDSMYNEIAGLKQQLDTTQSPGKNDDKLKTQLKEIEADYKALLNINDILRRQVQEQKQRSTTDINALKVKVQDLQRQLNDNNERLVLAQANFEKLKREFDAYRLKFPVTFAPESLTGSLLKPDDKSLIVKLITGSNMAIPENLTLYLVPKTPANRAIINDAAIYEIGCNEAKFRKVVDKKKAGFYNGNYFFNDVPPGPYFVKICSYYGNYSVIKKGTGSQTISMPLSPPTQK